jgi:hypothetical protein
MPPTKQEVFNKAWDWFVVQGHDKSMENGGGCRYRLKSGNKCAIGCVFPDDLDTKPLEGIDIETLLIGNINNPEIRPGKRKPILEFRKMNLLNPEDTDFYVEMQKAHDGISQARFSQVIKGNLEFVASKYNLTIPRGENN